MTILEAVEHNTSELTGTGTPDEIETDIIRIVSGLPALARVEAWRPGETPRTVHISRALAQLGKARGFNVRGKHCEGIADQGEWLFDHVWIDGERILLVLESEWGDQKKVDGDFEKIRLARADHRVLIFQVWHGDHLDGHFDRLAKQVRAFAYTQAGDRYLFLGYDFDAKVFKFRVLVA